MRHTFRCPLRWSDMDAYGHVNNVQFVRLLEEARVAIFFTESKADNVMTLDGQLVVVRHEIDYLAPLVYRPEPIDIDTWTVRIGGAACTVAYEIKDADTLYARALSVLAAINLETGRARRLTDEERTWINQWTDDAEAPA